MFIPANQCVIVDTWHVSGLRGTGSHDWTVSDLFVPAEGTVALATARPVQPGPLYASPWFALFTACLAPVPLGIARAAIDALADLANTKTPTGATAPLRERVLAQADIARAEALLRSARAFFHSQHLAGLSRRTEGVP